MQSSKIDFVKSLTFDDILLLPGFGNFDRSQIDLSTQITPKIKLKIPLMSSPMDTVTESEMAIALGKMGGIGIIHRNLTIEAQVKEVKKVLSNDILCGAAVGGGKGFEDRVDALSKVGIKLILIDSAHGWSNQVLEVLKFIKSKYKNIEVIAGNVATFEGAQALMKAGADGVRVGMGPGAICTTRIVSGMGVPQVSALLETVRAGKKYGIPIIADGGIKYSGDMVKALALGAQACMMGGFFASALESPGEKIYLRREQVPHRFQSIFEKNKKTYLFKSYRGMGSVGAMKSGAKIKSESEFHGKSYKDKVLVAEGVEGLVPVKGSVKDLVDQAIGGIKSGMYYIGAKNLEELKNISRFTQITQASLNESHPHDVLITNAGENYH